jgi:hypothetical protein
MLAGVVHLTNIFNWHGLQWKALKLAFPVPIIL